MVRRRKGATIALVAIGLAAILAMGALTVDLGMMFKMRGDAQRTADAAALAGASAYLEFANVDARDSALERAFRYVDMNYIGAGAIDTSGKDTTIAGNYWTVTSNHAVVEFAPDIYRVRVTVRRPAAPSFFGRILGVANTQIRAYAAAEATTSGGAECVRPWALADTWEESSSDANGNNFWDTGETWEYGDDDYYGPWDGVETDEPGDPTETGYGSSHRNNNGDPVLYNRDRGRQMVIKPQNPQVDQMIKPGHFFAWDMPDDPTQTVAGCPGGGGSGASDYEHNICECNEAEVFTDTEYDLKPGNMVGPTKQGVEALLKQDPGATWSETADGGKGGVIGSKYTPWRDSPRVIKVALFDPALEHKSGRISVKFNNIALMFIEDYQRAKGGGSEGEDAVVGRFLTFAPGSATQGGGPLAKVLRLVE